MHKSFYICFRLSIITSIHTLISIVNNLNLLYVIDNEISCKIIHSLRETFHRNSGKWIKCSVLFPIQSSWGDRSIILAPIKPFWDLNSNEKPQIQIKYSSQILLTWARINLGDAVKLWTFLNEWEKQQQQQSNNTVYLIKPKMFPSILYEYVCANMIKRHVR